jgi:GH43 family beta-xylosidase
MNIYHTRFTNAFFLRLALICTLLASLAVLTTSAQAQAGTFLNPLNPNTGSDPWMTYYNGNYYLATTTYSSSSSVGLTMKRAPSIPGLIAASPVKIWGDTTASRCCNMWAPEFHLLNGPNGNRWYIYYSAGPSGCCGSQRTYVLESSGTDPMGPYTFRGQLTDATNDFLIDPTVLQLNGNLYFIFSAFPPGDNVNQSLYIAPMSNPWTLSANRTRISWPTLSWEQVGNPDVNEGPEILQRGGRTFIIYSASYCGTPDYKLGMLTLTGSNPLSASSWTKHPNPVFQKNTAGGVYGPGHNGFFKSPNGAEDWIVYHATTNSGGNCGTGRTTRIQKFTWNADGTPNFGTPLSLNTSITLPAGDPGTGGATYYRLTNRNSGKVADVQQPNLDNGARIGQWAWGGNNWQQWQFVDRGGGYFNIVSRHSGKCLDVNGASTADGATIIQWTCGSGTNQQFQWAATGSFFNIRARHSSKCINVVGSSIADGAFLEQRACGSGNSFQWTRQ